MSGPAEDELVVAVLQTGHAAVLVSGIRSIAWKVVREGFKMVTEGELSSSATVITDLLVPVEAKKLVSFKVMEYVPMTKISVGRKTTDRLVASS